MTANPQVASHQWDATWPGCAPKPYALNASAPETLIRLTYANEGEDTASLTLERLNTLIDELVQSATDNESVYVVSVDWMTQGSDQPGTRPTGNWDVVPSPTYWRTLSLITEDPAYFIYQHLYLSEVKWKNGALDPLLEQCLSDCNDDLMICDAKFSWVCAPRYDRTDVYIASADLRTSICVDHPGWFAA